MAAVKKRKAAAERKREQGKKQKQARQKVKIVYREPKMKEPTMGDMSKMAMDGAVLAGSLGMMTSVAGMMSTAMKK